MIDYHTKKELLEALVAVGALVLGSGLTFGIADILVKVGRTYGMFPVLVLVTALGAIMTFAGVAGLRVMERD